MLASPKIDYYQGDQVDPTIRSDDSVSSTYGVRADAPAFQQLLTAMDAVASMPQSAITTSEGLVLIKKTRDMMEKVLANNASDGFENLTELQVRLNGPRSTLQSMHERHQNFVTYADDVIQGIEGVDQAELIAKLQSDQIQLEASYATLARITSLTILDFLR